MIDTSNKFLVGARGDGMLVIQYCPRELSREDALNLSAWLAALSDPNVGKALPVDGKDSDFTRLLRKVLAS